MWAKKNDKIGHRHHHFSLLHTHAKLNYHRLVGSSLRAQSLTLYVEESPERINDLFNTDYYYSETKRGVLVKGQQ